MDFMGYTPFLCSTVLHNHIVGNKKIMTFSKTVLQDKYMPEEELPQSKLYRSCWDPSAVAHPN